MQPQKHHRKGIKYHIKAHNLWKSATARTGEKHSSIKIDRNLNKTSKTHKKDFKSYHVDYSFKKYKLNLEFSNTLYCKKTNQKQNQIMSNNGQGVNQVMRPQITVFCNTTHRHYIRIKYMLYA